MSVWITATPPTPNGELHVGHMAGPYVAADVLRRFLVAEGQDVLLTTGLDDSQGYVATRALLDGQDPHELARTRGAGIVAAWEAADIRFDRIVEPATTPGYVEFVQQFFAKLHESGALVARNRPLPYCASCERWLYEAYLAGSCPHCGEDSNGNACEACGRPNDCGDLVDPRCVLCGAAAELHDRTRLYFPLAPFTDRLTRFWDRVAMPPHLRALCERMAADGLPEIAVSHPGDWGVPVPVEGFEDQRIYVWFEMAPGYLLEYDPEHARPADGPVQYFGFDNGYFHAVLFPAAFLAWAPDLPLPTAFVVNEFYRLEYKKFSTSRKHAVWARDALAEAGSDALRYHVLRDRPEGRQTNFERDDPLRAAAHLDAHWNGWLEELFGRLQAETGGTVPEERPGGRAWEVLRDRMCRLVDELRKAYSVEEFDPRRCVRLLDDVVSCGRDYGYVHEHERDRPHGRVAYRKGLAAQLTVASALAAWSAPVVPGGAARLSDRLGLPPGRRVDASALTTPPAGTRIGTGGRVFGSRP